MITISRRKKLCLTVVAVALVSLLVWVAYQERGTSGSSLERLLKEPALGLTYPGSTKLHHTETPKSSFPLEGIRLGAQIRDHYGTGASDKDVELFYRQEIPVIGWEFKGMGEGYLDTYRHLTYKKDRLTLEISLWFKKDFERKYVNLKTDGFETVYELLLYEPPK